MGGIPGGKSDKDRRWVVDNAAAASRQLTTVTVVPGTHWLGACSSVTSTQAGGSLSHTACSGRGFHTNRNPTTMQGRWHTCTCLSTSISTHRIEGLRVDHMAGPAYMGGRVHNVYTQTHPTGTRPGAWLPRQHVQPHAGQRCWANAQA